MSEVPFETAEPEPSHGTEPAPEPRPGPGPPPPPASRRQWPLPSWAVRATAWNLAVIAAVAVLAGLIWLLVELKAAVIPLLMAMLATSLLEPLSRRLTRRVRNRSLAAGLACGVLVAAVGGTVFLVVRAIVDASPGIGRALDRVGRRLGVGSVDQAVASAAEALKSMGSKTASALASGVVQGISTAAQVLTGAVLAVALIFFLLRDGHLFPSLVRSTLPEPSARAAITMARRAWSALSGFMRGTTIIALIDAALILVGLLILRIPGATGLAALVFVGAYVPYIGAFLSGTVAVFVALGDRGVGTALWVLGLILAVQIVEGNFLQPIVQSRTVSLHPAVVMFAVTGGTAIGGIVGALLAVPLTAAAFGMLSEWREFEKP